MKYIEKKLDYIILIMIVIVIILIILNNTGFKSTGISFYATGNNQNNGCLGVSIDEINQAMEYSFDGGKTWQVSNYGAIYQNGKTLLLARNQDKEIIYQYEVIVDSISETAPVINIDFDFNINSKSNSNLLGGVDAIYNGKDITSKIKTKILEERDNELLVSYFLANNGKSCLLIRKINVNDKVYADDKWLWPTDTPYKISRGYGWFSGKLHRGVDIYGLSRGAPIYSARSGVVTEITSNSSSGYYVIIKHANGYYTRYAHMQNTYGTDSLKGTSSATKYIKVGQSVAAHQIIGEIGSSGNSTGLHLHYEIWDGVPFKSQSYNPFLFYQK